MSKPGPKLTVSVAGRNGVSEPAGRDLPSNTSTTGRVVVDGGPETGVIGPLQGDTDWYAVRLESDHTYRIKVLGDPGVPRGEQVLDTEFSIKGPASGYAPFFNYNNGGGPDGEWEIVTWTADRGTGRHYIGDCALSKVNTSR